MKPAFGETFRRALANYVTSATKTAGNIMAEACYEEKDASTIWIIERWSHKRFLDRNDKSSAAKAVAGIAKNALVTPAEVTFLHDLEPLPKAAYNKQPATGDSPLTIMLFVDARPGTENEFKKIYHAAMPAFRGEPGVITYQLSQVTGNKTKFVTYEKFRSQEAFDYHLQFPPVGPVVQYLRTSTRFDSLCPILTFLTFWLV